jgi:hypothetical protein
MKLQKALYALIAVMFLFAAKTPAQQVKTDYDRNVKGVDKMFKQFPPAFPNK